jgi:hypothetical protein
MEAKKVLLALGKKVLVSWWRRDSLPTRRRSELHGEELESRCVPTKFLWNPRSQMPGQDWSWETSGNWMQDDGEGGWERTGSIPGEDPNRSDDVDFLGSYTTTILGEPWSTVNTNRQCYLLGTKAVNSVTIDKGYTSSFALLAGLTISGTQSGSGMYLRSPATIWNMTNGLITIAGSAVFGWSAGKLITNVEVGAQAKMNVSQRPSRN